MCFFGVQNAGPRVSLSPPRAWQMAPGGQQEARGPGGHFCTSCGWKGLSRPRGDDDLSSNPTPGCDLASPVSEKGDEHSSYQLWHGEGLNAEPALTALGFVPSGHSAVPLWPPPHMLQHMLRLHRVLLCRRTSMTFYRDCSYVIVCYSPRPKTRACHRGMTHRAPDTHRSPAECLTHRVPGSCDCLHPICICPIQHRASARYQPTPGHLTGGRLRKTTLLTLQVARRDFFLTGL